MIFAKNIFLSISIFCTLYFADNASSLTSEAIVNGIPASAELFTYYAAVLGVQGQGNGYSLLGGGAIVSEKHIVSAANVFYSPNGEMQRWKFCVVVGTHDILDQNVPKIDVYRVYVPSFDQTFIYFNIAVAELISGVGLGQNPLVSKVRVPDPSAAFLTEATVSGYGFHQIVTGTDPRYSLPIVKDGVISQDLRYRKVYILNDNDCATYYPPEVTGTNLCGKMQKENQQESSLGVCTGDNGSPLVVGDLLIGVVSSITLDCDNTIKPALYFKTSTFKINVDNFIDGICGTQSLLRYNWPYHMLPH